MECGCGRSPTGQCIGWHKLSEEEYQEKLKEHEDKDNEEGQILLNGDWDIYMRKSDKGDKTLSPLNQKGDQD